MNRILLSSSSHNQAQFVVHGRAAGEELGLKKHRPLTPFLHQKWHMTLPSGAPGAWAGPSRASCHLRPEALPHRSTAEGLKDTQGGLSVPKPASSNPESHLPGWHTPNGPHLNPTTRPSALHCRTEG